MRYYIRFLKGFLPDIKLFLWFLMLLSVFRLIFIFVFKDQLVDGIPLADVSLALWYGLRISLKTSGIFLLISFVLATVVGVVSSYWFNHIANQIRRILIYVGTFFFSLLFCVRIPYYTIFNSTFNIMLINGVKDDWWAILETAVSTYGLVWRLPIAIVMGVVLAKVGWWLVSRDYKYFTIKTVHNANISKPKLAIKVALWFVLISGGFVFLRFGGAFTYSNSINVENSSRLSSNLLNEAVLDDGQALYRVYISQKRLENDRKLSITSSELKNMIKEAGGNSQSTTIDNAFRHTIAEKRLPEQPNTVVFVLGESYGIWPFLDTFKGPGGYLVSQGMSLANSQNSLFLEGLAVGTGTMPAVNGYVTGMPDTGLYPNYEAESYKSTYQFGIGNVMKKLGYKTVFWYGGFGAWQEIRNFTLAQGFDEFREAPSFKKQAGNAWGVPDKVLFDEVNSYMNEHKGEKIFHFILTTSNHPPYDIDVKKEGFSPEIAKNHHIAELPKDEERVNELGHIWYSDQVMGQFVKNTEKIDSGALFVITGDHSERFTFDKEVDIRTHSGIPIIIYGRGINHNWILPQNYAGSLQLIPTLAVLVGNPGDTYDSLFPSIFESSPFVFNHALWHDASGYHKLSDGVNEKEQNYIKALKTISMWRIIKGNTIE